MQVTDRFSMWAKSHFSSIFKILILSLTLTRQSCQYADNFWPVSNLWKLSTWYSISRCSFKTTFAFERSSVKKWHLSNIFMIWESCRRIDMEKQHCLKARKMRCYAFTNLPCDLRTIFFRCHNFSPTHRINKLGLVVLVQAYLSQDSLHFTSYLCFMCFYVIFVLCL